MKIAILTSSLPPESLGGAEIQASETARRLADRGHDVRVFARRVRAGPPPAETRDGVIWVRCSAGGFPGLTFPGHVASFDRAWARYGKGVDVILAYQTVINGVLGARTAKRHRIPLVTWVRSEVEILLEASRKHRWFTPRVLAASDVVLVQTERLKRKLLDQKLLREFAGRTQVLGNAVGLGPEPDYDHRNGLVFLGRLVPIKGVDVLLDALRRLPDPPPRLRILGDGPLRDDLQARAEGLNVAFLGSVAPGSVARELADAQILVSPSRSEGFPNAILEAMERGVPSVATDVGGVPDVLKDGETGLLVRPDDPRALADKIAHLFADHELWERLARGARERAKSFGWESHLNRLESLLETTVVRRG